jgi:drug efflux transport system permease protein
MTSEPREKVRKENEKGRNVMNRTANSLRRLRSLIWKEALQIISDPSSILIAFVLPVVLLFLFGYAVSLDITRLKIGVALEERTAESDSLVAALRDSKYFDVKESFDQRDLERDLVSGRIRGIVIIPINFSRKMVWDNDESQVEVISDGSEPNTANFVQNYVRAAIAAWSQGRAMETGTAMRSQIGEESRVWFNPSLESKNYLVPGSIAIVLTLIGTLLTALVVAREWERGTMEALMATPVRIQELVLGKLIPYFCLGVGSMAFCTLVAVGIFRVPLRGSLLSLGLITSAFLVGSLGIGLLVSTLSKSQFVASQIALVLGFLPALQLSGFLFEISSTPLPIQGLTYLFPARYLVQALQTIFLAGDIPSLLWTNGLVLAGFAALFFFLTARVTRKRL